MLNDQSTTKKDEKFENAWFSRTPAAAAAPEPATAKKLSPIQKSIEEIKQYAYEAFDKLDQNGNGFIETEELTSFLQNPDTPMREKSFITFLLNNQEEIEKSCSEGAGTAKNGISRLDIEFYFRLVISQLS